MCAGVLRWFDANVRHWKWIQIWYFCVLTEGGSSRQRMVSLSVILSSVNNRPQRPFAGLREHNDKTSSQNMLRNGKWWKFNFMWKVILAFNFSSLTLFSQTLCSSHRFSSHQKRSNRKIGLYLLWLFSHFVWLFLCICPWLSIWINNRMSNRHF